MLKKLKNKKPTVETTVVKIRLEMDKFTENAAFAIMRIHTYIHTYINTFK